MVSGAALLALAILVVAFCFSLGLFLFTFEPSRQLREMDERREER